MIDKNTTQKNGIHPVINIGLILCVITIVTICINIGIGLGTQREKLNSLETKQETFVPREVFDLTMKNFNDKLIVIHNNVKTLIQIEIEKSQAKNPIKKLAKLNKDDIY